MERKEWFKINKETEKKHEENWRKLLKAKEIGKNKKGEIKKEFEE